MFGDKEEIIMSISFIPYLIAIWALFRSVTYIYFVKEYWGEEKFYSDPEFKEARRFFVGIKACPHPDLTLEQKEKWASSWWKYLILGLSLVFTTLFIVENLLGNS